MSRLVLLSLFYIVFSFASFPGMDVGWVAWLSMAPLLVGLRAVHRLRSFLLWVLVVEWIKWMLLVLWLRHVSWAAVLGVGAAFALYHSLWFLVLRRCLGEDWAAGFRKLTLFQVVALAALWASMEWLRTHPYGLPGAHFSITQWKYPIVLQSASVLGGYGLSALLVACNLWIVQLVFLLEPCGGWKRPRFWVTLIALQSLVFGVLGFGMLRLQNAAALNADSGRSARIGIVQPNMPPYRGWTQQRIEATIVSLWQSNYELVNAGGVDLVLWPEGSLPGSVHSGSAMEAEVVEIVDRYLGVPLVFGNQTIDLERKAYNAVLVVDPGKGILSEFYAKRILVPFGEFIPFRRYLPAFETIVPIPSDFERGRKQSVFNVATEFGMLNISPLICYEDCFPQLLLADDLEQVDFVFVATYNGWYGTEFGAHFHAAHSVLRAVEVGRSVVRCGSAGWSGWIDGLGRIRSVVSDERDSIYFKGSAIVEWDPDANVPTLYKRVHRWVHVGIGAWSLFALFPARRRNRITA